VGRLEVHPVVPVAHVLEHPHGDHAVELALQIPVVHQPENHGQALAAVLPPRDLLLGDGHTGALHPVVLGGELHERAPAAADVEHPLPRLQAELTADEVVLGLLGSVRSSTSFQ
jgi:hypothetical protein